MFVVSGQGPIGFGDVFRGAWLFDGHLREGSVPLRKIQPAPKGHEAAFAPARRSSDDWVLAYGRLSPAVLVDDDCHIEGVLEGREGGSVGGRLNLVAVRPGNDDEMEMKSHFSLLPWPDPPDGALPAKGFSRVVVDFNRRLSVHVKDAQEAERFKRLRVASPTEEGRSELAVRWSAAATRRGPMVAADASDKLARLLQQGGYGDGASAAQALGGLLGATWLLEGAAEDAIGATAEHRDDPAPLLDQIDQAYDEIERRLAAAREALAVARSSAPARG